MALVDVVVTADKVADLVELQAGEKGVLHVGLGIRITVEDRILMVFSQEILMAEDETHAPYRASSGLDDN